MQTTDNEGLDDSSSTKMPSGLPLKALAMDPELLFEERFGKVMVDNDNLVRDKKELEKQLRDLHDRLARLQENNVRRALQVQLSSC
jgi:protein HOOK3